MRFDDERLLKENGFSDFITVSQLQQTRCRDVPNKRGIYLIVRKDISEPQFSKISSGGHFKGRNPTVSIFQLREKWVDTAKVLYIGKAGSLNGNANLKNRLQQYMDFGQGIPVGHWGGRFIWQLKDSKSLQICWKFTLNENPRTVERQLIEEFMSYYNKLPFANLRR